MHTDVPSSLVLFLVVALLFSCVFLVIVSFCIDGCLYACSNGQHMYKDLVDRDRIDTDEVYRLVWGIRFFLNPQNREPHGRNSSPILIDVKHLLIDDVYQTSLTDLELLFVMSRLGLLEWQTKSMHIVLVAVTYLNLYQDL